MKNFQLKSEVERFSLPPSSNYRDPFDRFFDQSSLVAIRRRETLPKILSKKVNLFRGKLSSLISNDQVSFINPS